MSKKKQRNIIIGLSSIVLLMAIGYAAFATTLKIDGTSKISSTWDVQIAGITKDKTKGNVTEISEPTFDKESATFSVGLESPGDYIYYKVAVTNKGTLAAIAKLGKLSCGESNVLQCGAYADSNVGDIGTNTDLTSRRLIIGPGETEYYNIWIKYNNDITTQPDVTNVEIKLTLTYEQSDVGITHTTEDNCYTGKVLDNGTLTITDYDEKCGTDVVIPETIDGYTVTEIANSNITNGIYVGPFPAKNIRNVQFPDTIKKIGSYAFFNNKLTSVTMPKELTHIGGGAFEKNQITNLILNENLQQIDWYGFSNNKISILNIPSSLTKIGDSAFHNNSLSELTIPSTVMTVGSGAFAYNNLSGENAFVYQQTNGVIDNTKLNSYAGKSASNLVFPENIKTIGTSAFRDVYITNLVIPSNITVIEGAAFQYNQMSSLVLNEGLKTIGNSAFSFNQLTKLTIPNSVTNIETKSFVNNKLQTVTIGSGIKTIGANAFQTSGSYNPITSITINRKEGSVSGSPWGATKAQINWTGTN